MPQRREKKKYTIKHHVDYGIVGIKGVNMNSFLKMCLMALALGVILMLISHSETVLFCYYSCYYSLWAYWQAMKPLNYTKLFEEL